ncbi:hypothetical protein N5923_15575 [Erwiniaceae bacterium BAC15a-03b]|uniref:Uncharacterized protein n=2 Tax=Winslowiella arboricola TaxID=2978220 RepID=A0A9J6PTP0_9GAMM|nr:hypothetical protein [Winslowiella arboricola]MCU5774365.1 hypothetical protein [Winslowiella arboricola]MCU5778912.1 hypothetical protein [Winslowiella arboricola]
MLFLFSSRINASEINLYSLNTGSFIYHIYAPGTNKVEYFKNQYVAVERKFSEDSKYSMVLGTLNNSQGNRCALMGVRRDWWSDNSGWTIKGLYTYTGEFFFDTFSHCGDDGFYHSIKQSTGLGFAPYVYHAAQYNFTSYFGVEGGIILPGIFVVSMQWSFR